MITPLSLMSGEAWHASRNKLSNTYRDVVLLSIAGKSSKEISFSADTGMAEAMFVGIKCREGEHPSGRATFAVLDDRPSSPLDGYAAADALRKARDNGNLRRLEDGPFGGSAITVGADIVGYALDAPLHNAGTWDVCRIADLSLAQSAWQLMDQGILWLPSMTKPHSPPLPLRAISEMIAWIGPYHADINWSGSGGKIRGPFKTKATGKPESATYPILWAHDAERERSMVFEADHEGIVRPGKNKSENDLILEKVEFVQASASHLHFNQNFQFNSQSTAMQYTRRRTIGGRAWMSLRFPEPEREAAVALWGNTSLGVLLHWWQANKQQKGRGNVGKTALDRFVCLDPARLSERQLKASADLLAEFSSRSLRPINEIAVDENRAQLDQRFLVEILGLPKVIAEKGGALSLLRAKLAAEPSINGGKKIRPSR